MYEHNKFWLLFCDAVDKVIKVNAFDNTTFLAIQLKLA